MLCSKLVKLEEVFVNKKVKNTVVLWTYVISELNGEKIVGTFYEKRLQKANETDFRVKKVAKRNSALWKRNFI